MGNTHKARIIIIKSNISTPFAHKIQNQVVLIEINIHTGAGVGIPNINFQLKFPQLT